MPWKTTTAVAAIRLIEMAGPAVGAAAGELSVRPGIGEIRIRSGLE